MSYRYSVVMGQSFRGQGQKAEGGGGGSVV